MMWESSYIQLVITVSLLGDKMTHHWMNNLLIGHICTCHKYKQLPLVTYGPMVSLAQISLMKHQCTDLPANKHKKKSFVKPRPPSHKNDTSDRQSHYKKSFDARNVYKHKDRCQKCGDSNHNEGFQCPAKEFQCKSCDRYGHFTGLYYQKKHASFKSRKPKAHMLQVGAIYACDKSICGHSEDFSSSDGSFCLQVKIQWSQAEDKKIPTPSHLIANLAYKLKSHQTKNQYLRARLDTWADVNIMPASVYKLMFNGPELKKLAPSNSKIGTYTTDTVMIVESCLFYLVHLDTKKLQEVTFYVAQNDGSVLLSCTTTLVFGLIQPCTRLDYLPPRSILITSSLEHPKEEWSIHTKQQSSGYSTWCKTICSPFSHKQRGDFTKLPRCV